MAASSRPALSKPRNCVRHIVCCCYGVRTGILSVLLLTEVACSPAQRATVGGAIGAAGLAVAGDSIESMVIPSCRLREGEHHACVEYYDPLPGKVGVPLVLMGIGVAMVGGAILATSVEPAGEPPKAKPTMPALPDEPTTFDETEAVGMAVAQLVSVGLDTDAKPSRLLGVDDAQVTVHAKDRHAELWNLRIRTVADESWRPVGACYEYEHEWRLTSLRATPGCQ